MADCSVGQSLAAGLYAPLRVFLYENEIGGSIFEYDKPSSLFGQFDAAVADAAFAAGAVCLGNAEKRPALPPTPERLRQRSESTLRANCGNVSVNRSHVT